MFEKSKLGALFTACAILFCIGLLGSSVGPVLPDISRNTHTDLVPLGSIFTVLFFGALVTQTVTGPATDRFGHKLILAMGLILIVFGVATITASNSLPLVLGGAAVTGLGQGMIILSTNLFVAQVFAARSVAALNLTNVFYGIGAITGPALAGLFLGIFKTALPILWVAVGLFVLLIPLVLVLPARHSRAGSTLSGENSADGPVPVFSSPVLWLFGILLLIYVGTEVGTGGWMVTHITHSTTLTAEVAALITSGYYLALTAGRLVASFVGALLSGQRLLFVSICLALLGAALLALGTGNVALTVAGALIFGFSLGPIYPTAVAIVASLFPSSSGKAAGAVMTMGSTGGLVLPWLLGVLILQVGSRLGMTVIAGCALTMLLLCIGVSTLSSRKATRMPPVLAKDS
jgi:fucose permease